MAGATIPMSGDGRVMYYSDYNTNGGCKRNREEAWTCCTGTRPQVVADCHDLIYFKDADTLAVCLYTPSTVVWQRRGGTVTIRQQTNFPEAPTASFTISLPAAARFGIKLRLPDWLAVPLRASVNGKALAARQERLHWVSFVREWREGDRLSVELPMKFWVSRLDVSRAYPAAIMYGPVAMAVCSPRGNPAAKIDLGRLDRDLLPVDGEALVYRLAADHNVLVKPFYAFKEGEPYYLYLSR
ncbi:MAG: hypothetical protein ACP5XB_09775 [Isosphaeraceae bacterium]